MTYTDYKLKIVAIMCFAFIAISSFIAYANPAKGYELSIYASTPATVWVFLIASMIGGVTIIVHQATTKGYKNNRFWLIGLLITILAQETLFYLAYIRGYLLWEGADTTEHILITMGILSTGHFSSENFYPITHILLSETILLTGMPTLTVIMFSGAFLLITYILSIYLLASIVLPEMEQRLLALASTAGIPIILNIYTSAVFPVYWSVVVIPFLLFLVFKRSTVSYSILLVIFLVLLPFFHVFSSLMVIVALAVIELSRVAYSSIVKHGKSVIPMPHFKFSLTPILIESIIIIIWILSFTMFHRNLQIVWLAIITGEGGPDIVGAMGTRLGKINVHGFDFVELLLKIYGTEIIFIFLSLIAAFILIKQIRSGNIKKETQSFFSLLIVFLFIYVLYLLYLLGAPGLHAIAGERLLFIATLFPPIFAGFALYELSKKARFRHLASICIICVIILASVLAIFSYYPSPYTQGPNNQVTLMDMAGMTWFIEQKNTNIGHAYIATFPGKFVITVLGYKNFHERQDLFDRYRYYIGESFQDHFTYTNHSSLGESYVEDRYSAITKYDRVIYTTVWKVVGRFNDSDFEKLERDSSVDKLYANGELDVYFIHSIRTTQ